MEFFNCIIITCSLYSNTNWVLICHHFHFCTDLFILVQYVERHILQLCMAVLFFYFFFIVCTFL
jgi:hypothetical protein